MLTQTIKTQLEELGIQPKKSLGQNFLINEGVYKKIVAAAEIQKGNTVVEVGPGLGTLTQYLLAAGANVIAVEKDHQFIDHLKTKFADEKHVKIVEEDILEFKVENLKFKIPNYKVIGNIPYYLTSHLLRTIFEKWFTPSEIEGPQPELIVLMIQKEVAQRIVAKPPKMSLLAISVQYYTAPEIISYVSRGSFYPSPEVDSAIIRLVASDQLLASSKDLTRNYKLETGNFFRVVQAGFAKKRKQLANNLSAGLKTSKEKAEQLLLSAGIDPRRRAETLTLKEWQGIVTIFSPH